MAKFQIFVDAAISSKFNYKKFRWFDLATDAEEIVLELIQQNGAFDTLQEKPLKPGGLVSLSSYSIIINFGGQ